MITLNQNAPAAVAAADDGDGGHFYELVGGVWVGLHPEGGTLSKSAAMEMSAAGRVVQPSATGYIAMLDKPQLKEYAMEQAALAAVEVPRNQYEDEKAWLKAVKGKAKSASHGARDLGGLVHRAVENFLKGRDYDAAYQKYVEAVVAQLNAHNMAGCSSEKIVGSAKLGAAGTADLIHQTTMTIGDIKTRKHRVNKVKPSRVPVYETDFIQTAFYGFCEFGSEFFVKGRAVILATSTVVPGLVTPHVKTGPELVPFMEAFIGLTAAYRCINKWDPRKAA